MSKSSWLATLVLGCTLAAGVGWMAAHQHYRAMQQAQTQATAAVDIPFLQHMTVHHSQALTLSEAMGSKQNTQWSALARQIEVSQRLQMGMFKAWLQSWQAEPLPRQLNMDWMTPHATEDQLMFINQCKASGTGMTGLASMDQINHLLGAQGAEADALFAQLMRAHHLSAIPMLEYAAQWAHTAEVRELAASMLAEQRQELTVLKPLNPQP